MNIPRQGKKVKKDTNKFERLDCTIRTSEKSAKKLNNENMSRPNKRTREDLPSKKLKGKLELKEFTYTQNEFYFFG